MFRTVRRTPQAELMCCSMLSADACSRSLSRRRVQSRMRRTQRRHYGAIIICKEGGMYVPSDSFNGMSPERKAAQAMVAFFTFVAARIVLAQLVGSGRGALGSYNAEASDALMKHLQDVPIKDGDAWIQMLMSKNEMLGVRIMEVRTAYARDDFEWHKMETLSLKELEERNTQLMRTHATRAFKNAFQADADNTGRTGNA